LRNKKIHAEKKILNTTKNRIKNFRIQKYVPKIEIQNISDKSFKNIFSHFCVSYFRHSGGVFLSISRTDWVHAVIDMVEGEIAKLQIVTWECINYIGLQRV